MVGYFNYSSNLAFINLALFLFLTIKYRRLYGCNSLLARCENMRFVVSFLTLFSVFAFAEADTYHYMGLYEDLYSANYSWHVEPIHYWIIKHIPHGYFLWRTVVWGIAAVVYVIAFKCLKIDHVVIGFVITVVMLPSFPQTRGSLGFAIMIFAIACYKQTNVISLLFVIALIILATLFHKSLNVYTLFYLIAMSIPYNKKTIILSCVLFPIFYYFVYALSSYILYSDLLGEQTVGSGISYLERGSEGQFNVLGLLTNSILWLALLIYFYCSSNFYINVVKNKTALNMHKYAYVMVYISFLFYGQNISSFLFTRTLNFAMFPLAVAFAYYLQNEERTTLSKIAVFLFWLNTAYYLSYHIYKFNG